MRRLPVRVNLKVLLAMVVLLSVGVTTATVDRRSS